MFKHYLKTALRFLRRNTLYTGINALGLSISLAVSFITLLFVVRSRTHEIGIKKVFGSSERAIVYSFLRSNFFMVLVAALLSIPVTLYFFVQWLKNYPYRVGIEMWIFVIAFLIATLVVFLTVSIHSIKASRINPVDALRYE